jgi:ADP-ribosyl-[dinitrogen reductase] hydrolase
MQQRDRWHGCLLGLAVGDAVGTAVEFRPRGTFEPITDMVGGGPFRLLPGQWTDDTSMALCLATSLVEREGFDADDQMRRYVRWAYEGYLSSTGRCFDIGNSVRSALERFRHDGNPYAGSSDPNTAGNGCIMRLAPIPMFFCSDLGKMERFAADSARTTHGASECIDACRLFARMICRALHVALVDRDPKREVLLGDADSFAGSGNIVAIARGEYLQKPEAEIRGSGYVVRSLEAALWAFARTDSFENAILMAANLGDDADTTAAVCGQLAGAYYGKAEIPARWLQRLALRAEIQELADQLHQLPSRLRSGRGISATTPPRERAHPTQSMRPMPPATALLPFKAEYSAEECDTIAHGHLSKSMDDKWDIVAHDGRIRFHRSWTGICVYDMRLEEVGGRYRVAEARVNRDPMDYTAGSNRHDEEYDAALLGFLIDDLLLGRGTPFPLPSTVNEKDGPAFQHHISGTGYALAPRMPAPNGKREDQTRPKEEL